jgi:hypothetical protein
LRAEVFAALQVAQSCSYSCFCLSHANNGDQIVCTRHGTRYMILRMRNNLTRSMFRRMRSNLVPPRPLKTRSSTSSFESETRVHAVFNVARFLCSTNHSDSASTPRYLEYNGLFHTLDVLCCEAGMPRQALDRAFVQSQLRLLSYFLRV